LDTNHIQYLIDIASGYVTWAVSAAPITASISEGTVTTLLVHNYGRFPITDAHVAQDREADAQADEVNIPLPLGPGAAASIDGGNRLNDGRSRCISPPWPTDIATDGLRTES